MWLGPTAKLLSEGFRNIAVPAGPGNPTPSPSKLSSIGTAGRLPCDLCSTAAPASVIAGAGGGGGIGSSRRCCGGASPSASASLGESASPDDGSQGAPSHPAGCTCDSVTCDEASGAETSNFAARRMTTDVAFGPA